MRVLASGCVRRIGAVVTVADLGKHPDCVSRGCLFARDVGVVDQCVGCLYGEDDPSVGPVGGPWFEPMLP